MIIFSILGCGLLATVLIKPLAKKYHLSIPIAYTVIGFIVATFVPGVAWIDPIGSDEHGKLTEYLTEFAVIVSLLAAGLSLDRPFRLRSDASGRGGWLQVWPLLGITMPLTIVAIAAVGYWMLGFSLGAAMLIGAALSPTDPVLARSVQVGPPGEQERDDVRFDLTVEAGCNDSLAFPFTYLAMAIAAATASSESVPWMSLFGEWVAIDVAWRLLAGVVVGLAIGRGTAYALFRSQDESERDAIRRSHGVVVFGMLFAAYGIAEIVEGYGFLAVFVGAVTIRQCEPESDKHDRAHLFADQVEQIVLVGLLLSLGALVAQGILDALTWQLGVLGAVTVLVFRPLFGWLALLGPLGHSVPRRGRTVVAFCGVKGLGTIYYLAYATNNTEFERAEEIWAVCIFAILVSICVHGIATPILVRRAEKHNALTAE